MDPEKGSISIKDNFFDRQTRLAEQLLQIEKSLNKDVNHKGSKVPRLEDLSTDQSNRNKIKGFQGRQSIFKRPELPPPRHNIRTIAEHHRNPTKWTYYSLDDVPDMSNEMNSQTALAFLDDLKKRKRREAREAQKQNKIKDKLKVHIGAMEIDTTVDASMEYEDIGDEERFVVDDSNKSTIVFKKPHKQEEPFKPVPEIEFRDNKFIMPEYQVGTKKISKKNKTQKSKSQKIDKNKELKLDHLQQCEDEEE